ncbi:MAG: PD40 domain-containing protein [Chloroflexi bacterium]|nr:PD40 domain-containing protein [Chloroflexota bacterium]
MTMPSQSIALDSFATFGDLLKFLRRRARLTQLELSIAVGYSEAQISRLEKNLRLPDLATLKALFVPALHLEHEPETTTRLLTLAESARQEDAPVAGVAPYKGLLFFDEADADWFFGREALTAHLVEHLNALGSHLPRLLAIVGASGSGKSSIVRAGLAVALKRAGYTVRVFTPTAQPIQTLDANLARDARPNVIIVDQFEEVFTLCRDENARAELIARLLDRANDANQRTTIVIALRADFYSHCAQYPQLRDALAAHQEYIGQMTRAELRHAIQEPAHRGGWEFEPGLIDLMLSDVGAGGAQDQEPGALPLLSHALLATWEHRCGRMFTLAGYRAAGGVQRAIAETAESVFTDQLNQAQQHLARDIFLRLTELGEGTEDTRRRAGLNELVPRAEQAAQLRAVLNTLADARLVMLGVDSAEVAHEALIREWSRLREWLNENREGLRLHRHLSEAAQSWERLKRDEGELYRGARLAHALEWSRTNSHDLNTLEREFLDASKQLAERQAQEREAQRLRELIAAQTLAETQTRAAQQLRKRAVLLAGMLLLVAFLALFAFQTAQRAEIERRIAFARELSVSSVNNLGIDPERSILLALEAVSVSSTNGTPVLREAEEALHRAVQTSRVQLAVRGHSQGLFGAAFSPDGKRIATASTDRTSKVFDAATGKELFTLSGHTAVLRDVIFNPDGTQIATASLDKTVKIWDAATGREMLTLAGHTDGIYAVIFSADGKRIATASADKTAKVWDAITGQTLLTLVGHTELVQQVAFSPDGARLATASNDRVAKVWDAVTGRELYTLSGHTNSVWDITFTPDGTRLATAGFDGSIKIWDIISGRLISTLNYPLPVSNNGFAFNSAGTRLIVGRGDGTALLWDVATGQVVLELRGHTGPINKALFSPDSQGTRVLTAGADGMVRIWDVSSTSGQEWFNLATQSEGFRDIAYSRDGTWFATAGRDKTAKVWDAATGKELFTLVGHTNFLRAIAISPDAKRIATIGDDQTLRVWDAATGKMLYQQITQVNALALTDHCIAFSPDGKRLAVEGAGFTIKILDGETGKELLTLSGHTETPRTVAFSPDGKRLASSGDDAAIKVWDLATGREILTMLGHKERIYSVASSPDGARLASAGSDGIVKVWDVATGRELLALVGHSGIVFSAAYSPDGMRLVSSSSDTTVKVWDVSPTRNRSQEPLTFYGNSASVYRAVFSPDGKRLATAATDGARVYALPIQDIIAIAKSRLTRTWTPDECQKFLHTDQCPADPRQ